MDFLDYTDLQNEVEITDSASESRAAVPVSSSATATPAPSKDSVLAPVTQNLCLLLLCGWTQHPRQPCWTVTGNSNTVRCFESFCQLHGHDFPNFSSVAVTQFVLHQVTCQSSFSFLATIKPALTYLKHALDHPTAFTPAIDLLISGAKRRAKRDLEDLAMVLHAVCPPEDKVGLASAQDLRTTFWALIIYHTLCRFDCFSHLQAKHSKLVGPDIMISFPTAKNDQLHNGQHASSRVLLPFLSRISVQCESRSCTFADALSWISSCVTSHFGSFRFSTNPSAGPRRQKTCRTF